MDNPARLVRQHVSRPDILVDEPASMDLPYGGHEADRQAQEPGRVQRPARELAQGSAAGICQNQKGAPPLAR